MTSLWKPSIVPWRNHSTERLGLKNGWTCTLKCKPPSSKWWTTNQDFTRHFNGHLQHLAWPRLSTSASLNTTKTGVWVWNTVADIVRLFSILWSDQLSSFEQNFLEFSWGTVLLHTKVVLAALRFWNAIFRSFFIPVTHIKNDFFFALMNIFNSFLFVDIVGIAWRRNEGATGECSTLYFSVFAISRPFSCGS